MKSLIARTGTFGLLLAVSSLFACGGGGGGGNPNSPTPDTTPPETFITSQPDPLSNSGSARFEFSCSKTICTFHCRIDSGVWQSCTSPSTYSGLSESSHTFDVAATDSFGNEDPVPASCTWTVQLGVWLQTSDTNPPPGRYLHTAVRTGAEMIIWGGYYFDGANHYLKDGAKYDPATNSWTPTSATDAPSARAYHSAVWTGAEMIVWGGYNGVNLNNGAKYNPALNTWMALPSAANSPSARRSHTAVWTGNRMIIWGGIKAGSSFYLNNGAMYRPDLDLWDSATTTNAPEPRIYHTAVWTGNGMIVWGGYNPALLDTGGIYDPLANSWTATSMTNAPLKRRSHTAVWTGTEMVVWGGFNGGQLNTGAKYNPGLNTWTATSTDNAPIARDSHAAVWTGTQMVIWGGSNGSPINTGSKYIPESDGWIPLTTVNAPEARIAPSAVWTGTEMIVWGGYSGPTYFNSGARWKP